MSRTYTKLVVANCFECPLRDCSMFDEAGPQHFCTASQQPLKHDKLDKAPDWCPARDGVSVKLHEMPELPSGTHRWTERGERALKANQAGQGETFRCLICGLKRKAVERWVAVAGRPGKQKVQVWAYLVKNDWTQVRPNCPGDKDKDKG